MPDESDFNSVVSYVQVLSAASEAPVLTDVEVIDIVRKCQRGSTWTASTAYTEGSIVVPSAANGHRYRVTIGGTSGATEPTWPTNQGRTVEDGTVTFEEAGPGYASLYDVRSAVHAAWLLKAAKATPNMDFSADGRHFSASQVKNNCLSMAQQYKPLYIA